MLIGIIGSGMIGGTLAELLVPLGHEVRLANSRGPWSLREFVADHPGISPATIDEASRDADLVVLAIPFGRYRDIPADAFAGRVVIDATNYYPDRDKRFPQLDDRSTTSTELVAAHLTGAQVVKAFNTIYFEHLRAQRRPDGPVDERRALPIAGNDIAAKNVVAALIGELGFTPVDAGPLAEGRRQQPGTPVYNVTANAADVRALLTNA